VTFVFSTLFWVLVVCVCWGILGLTGFLLWIRSRADSNVEGNNSVSSWGKREDSGEAKSASSPSSAQTTSKFSPYQPEVDVIEAPTAVANPVNSSEDWATIVLKVRKEDKVLLPKNGVVVGPDAVAPVPVKIPEAKPNPAPVQEKQPEPESKEPQTEAEKHWAQYGWKVT
jgi:hypothetical protein